MRTTLSGKGLLLVFLFLLLLSVVVGHGEEEVQVPISPTLSERIVQLSLQVIAVASVIILILVLFSIICRKYLGEHKMYLFLGIVLPIVIATLFLAGATFYKNYYSLTGGPVHWHADFEIWVCGEKVDVKDPVGLLNRVGTPFLHEHGDLRIHVEGVVHDLRDVDLHNFFRVIGGELTPDRIMVPTNEGVVDVTNGALCGSIPGTLQAFVYKTKGDHYYQKKLDMFPDYVLSPHTYIPPGDCVILEFGEEKATTEHICSTYASAIQRGELSGS